MLRQQIYKKKSERRKVLKREMHERQTFKMET